MNREKELNDILDVCLKRLSQGDTPQQCLTSYPDQATQLEPLLRLASLARAAVAITPRPEFKARSWQVLSQALRERTTGRAFPFFSFMPRWAVAVSLCLVFLAAGSGTVAAASRSMPDSYLYPVKLATERVQLQLSASDLSKAELYVRLADRRVTEITNMAEKNKPEKIVQPAQRLDELLVSLAGTASVAPPSLMEAPLMAPAPAKAPVPAPAPEAEPSPMAEPAPEAARAPEITLAPSPDAVTETTGGAPPMPPEQAKLIESLRRYQTDHPEKLRRALEKAPPSLKPLLQQIIEHSQASYQQALKGWKEARD